MGFVKRTGSRGDRRAHHAAGTMMLKDESKRTSGGKK